MCLRLAFRTVFRLFGGKEKHGTKGKLLFMKYRGYIYEGCAKVHYDDNVRAFEDPYDALAYANEEWSRDPNLQIARFLTVVRTGESAEEKSRERYAFFQFTDFHSCKKFATAKSEIVWSEPENQIWNGNARQMG